MEEISKNQTTEHRERHESAWRVHVCEGAVGRGGLVSWEPGEVRMKVEGGQDCPRQPGSLPSITEGEKPVEGFEGRATEVGLQFRKLTFPRVLEATGKKHMEAGKETSRNWQEMSVYMGLIEEMQEVRDI